VTVNTSKEAIIAWCQGYLADILEVPAAAVDPGATFDHLGVGSAIAVSLLINVEAWYGVELPAQALFDALARGTDPDCLLSADDHGVTPRWSPGQPFQGTQRAAR